MNWFQPIIRRFVDIQEEDLLFRVGKYQYLFGTKLHRAFTIDKTNQYNSSTKK